MPKKKKYSKLPNGYGHIKHLSGKRKNPYAVYPPAKEGTGGKYAAQKAICYTDTWMKGFSVLTAWHAGSYYPGYERTLNDLSGSVDKILADYAQAFRQGQEFKDPSFAEVYEDFFEWKYGENAKKKLSRQSEYATRSAFNNCEQLHKKAFKELRHKDLQDCIDNCPLKSASIENMVSLIKQMYKYALLYEICERDYSIGLAVPQSDDEHGIPFSDDELRILWLNKDNPVIEFVLIMCYSGYRITAYKTMEVNTDEWYFKGGVKTAAGKDRIVPIHGAIQGLVKRRIRRDGCILNESAQTYRKSLYEALSALGIKKHTPHDCRHTFSCLCEKYGVNENDRKRMMGHSFGADITNGIYGHRDLEDLRNEIEKIDVPFVTNVSQTV